MREVVLFTVSKKKVTAYGDYVPIMTYDPPVRCWNTPDLFIKSEVDVHHANVHRFAEADKYGYYEQFVAFDPALQSIVNTLIHTAVECESRIIKRISDGQLKNLHDQIKELQSRTIWSMMVEMLVSKFKRSTSNGS